MANTIDSVLSSALEGIKSIADTETIIGNAIHVNDQIILIPVSKVSFGFAAGGTSYGKEVSKDNFGGGAGGGVKVTPIAFLVINGTDVRIIYLNENPDIIDKLSAYVPDAVDKIASVFKKDQDKAE